MTKTRDVWEYGDFQTPQGLATTVCAIIRSQGVSPDVVIEPTCGRGSFLETAKDYFPEARLLGLDINPAHLAYARERLGERPVLTEADFFRYDWDALLANQSGSCLVIGNPPWVTSSELGVLASSNVPAKSNYQQQRGIDSITGKGNFDISEWMLLRYLAWLQKRGGTVAVLVKTAVARKVLVQAWKKQYPIQSASMHLIDAMAHFEAAVDACLLVLHVVPGTVSFDCAVFDHLDATIPSHTLGFHDGQLVSRVEDYLRLRHLTGLDAHYVWRSGIKHDCSRVMELTRVGDRFRNGDGEEVDLEETYLYPMLKSSDVAKVHGRRNLYMLVPQQRTGEETRSIEQRAPQTWDYLNRHAEILGQRASSIYRNRPPFSVFGVGDYSFALWKVVISGFYKSLRFVTVAPQGDRPIVIDDTIYSLPCKTQDEAVFLTDLLNSEPARIFYTSMIFWSDKRPTTIDLLKRLDIRKVAIENGTQDAYDRFVEFRKEPGLQQLALLQ